MGLRRYWCFICGLLSFVALPIAATEVRNGSFERGAKGWAMSSGVTIVSLKGAPHGKFALKCQGDGASASQPFIVTPNTPYSLTLWFRMEGVKPLQGSGYAYAAVYEFDFHGNLLAFRDFVQAVGTQDWQQAKATWTSHPRAFYTEVRLGLYNAEGIAWFDGVQVVQDTKVPDRYTEAPFVKGLVALVVDDSMLPSNPAAPSPQQLASLLRQAGYRPQFVTFEQLARIPIDSVRLVVLPNAPFFPLEAHRPLLKLLMQGTDLLTFGGYAFDAPLVRTSQGYLPIRFGEPLTATLLNENPGFERVGVNESALGWKRTDERHCFVTIQTARSGQRCAVVRLPQGSAGSAMWSASVPVQTGDHLRLSAWVKVDNVTGNGYAFVAYYPFSGDHWVDPRDIAQLRTTQDWQFVSTTFVVPYGVDRVEVRFGIYNACGTAYFDEVRLERVDLPPCVNTHYGKPHDGLEISSLQLGMFDPHHLLHNAVQLKTVSPFVEKWAWQAEQPLTGFSAVGVLCRSARWQPLVAAYDRFGREVGTVGALMHHFSGPFADSTWVFFGVDNVDLTTFQGFNERVLLPLLHRLRKGIYLFNLRSHSACYRPGEPVEVSVQASNTSGEEFNGMVVFTLKPEWREDLLRPFIEASERTLPIRLAAGETQTVTVRWEGLEMPEGLYSVTARVGTETAQIDAAEAGLVIFDGHFSPDRLPPLSGFGYAHNYFSLNGQPTFLLGTDTWANWFHSPSQSDPLFWWRQLLLMRDAGLTVFENLQWTPPQYRFTEAEWRQLDALIYLSHHAGLVYMAGLLIGHDVAVDDDELERQAQFVTEFARRYRDAVGLIYYLNGDYQLRPKMPEQQNICWQIAQVRQWNERLARTIKAVDPQHPTTSEYYQRPVGGIELRQTIDGLDVANIGYFDEPGKDLRCFGAVFKLADMRLYGKSLNIGEFGVKTHPAWERTLGAIGYHIRRTEEEQWRMMLLVPQFAFALGASKVQNWCWRDDDDRVFPWGLVYPCDNVLKPAFKAYRAAAFLLQQLRPIWRKPKVVLIVPFSNLAEPSGEKVWWASLIAADTLLRLRVDFAVANDFDLSGELLEGVKVAFLPGALKVAPETEAVLKAFIARGGVIYRSGAGGEEAWEVNCPEVGMQTPEQLERYRQVLQQAGVEGIPIEPNFPTLLAFRVPLLNGVVFVFVNASDAPVSFAAYPSDMPSICMSLGAWQVGMVALDQRRHVFLLEGNGKIGVGDEWRAEGDGHFIVWADEGDIHTARRLWLIPTEATTVKLCRHSKMLVKVAEIGEWCFGLWRVLTPADITVSDEALVVRVDRALRGEIIRIAE